MQKSRMGVQISAKSVEASQFCALRFALDVRGRGRAPEGKKLFDCVVGIPGFAGEGMACSVVCYGARVGDYAEGGVVEGAVRPGDGRRSGRVLRERRRGVRFEAFWDVSSDTTPRPGVVIALCNTRNFDENVVE